MNLSKFAETLSELLVLNEMKAPALAKQIGCGRNTINRYLNGNQMPDVEILVRIADYFNCTVDFLMGIDAENKAEKFAKCPPFSNRLGFLCDYFNKTKYALQKGSDIPESAIYSWQRGETSPNIESIIKIAEFFECSVDFVLGREL